MTVRFLALPVVLCALALAGAGCTGDDAVTTTTTSVVDTTATTTTTTLPPLVGDYPFGYGFHLSAVDQTVALFVELADYRDFYEGPLPEVTVLPDPMWEAEVRIGHDLFADWGGGVSTPTDPRSVVDEVWPVVAGTITILEMPSTEDCGPARALFENFEAVTGDGTRVHLGDFNARNEWWGCFAL
jgi:hypothetical protein